MAQKITKSLTKFYTHGGTFHADDVFATAILSVYLDREIIPQRVFNLDGVVDDEETLIYDIGGGKYDHHQEGSEVRNDEEKTPYSSFGLLWREIGPELVGELEADMFDRYFVKAIDLTDNTGISNPMSQTISTFNPSWKGRVSPDCCFRQAVRFAGSILQMHLNAIQDKLDAQELANQFISEAKDGIAVFDRFVPAARLLSESECIFQVFPSNRGGWNLQTIKVPNQDKALDKKSLPASWLEPGHAPNGMSFCHKALFLAAFDTEEHAIAAAYKALAI